VTDVPQNEYSDSAIGDRRDGEVYVYTPEIELALEVALATGRPLLVGGPTGCGKSSLARHAAKKRNWRYYEKTITSLTQARDLLWEVDHLRRLQDAHDKKLGDDFTPYVRPAVLWWAMNRASAAVQAKVCSTLTADPNLGDEHSRAVVLLDEIDKADPDVPNNLLVPLGSFRFQVEETSDTIELDPVNRPLIIMTTNDERELPAAFLRRCIELRLEAPKADRLLAIAAVHFPEHKPDDLKARLDAVKSARPESWPADALPSPAEFIDHVRATTRLKTSDAAAIARLVVWKQSQSGKVAG
jgi:MoxR-like ATPase